MRLGNIQSSQIAIANVTRQAQRLYDNGLPGGMIEVPPYDGTDATTAILPREVFARVWRISWLKRASDAVPVDNPIVPRKVREAQAEAEADSEYIPGMREIRERARAIGLKIPVGTSRKAAYAMLTQAEENQP